MVAGFFPAASLAIHLGRDEPAGEGWAEQKMIDPQPGVSRISISEEFPERIDPLVRVKRAQRIKPTLRDNPVKGVAHLGAEQGVIAPALNSQQFLGAVTDEQIQGIIAGGVPGTAMPAWLNEYGGPLTDQEIAEVVAYLRSWEATAPSRPDWRTPGTG